MGFRMHVARIHKVEYGSTEAFNYAVEELHNLLSALEVLYSGDSYDNEFEVDKEEWLRGLKKLKNLANLEEDDKEGAGGILRGAVQHRGRGDYQAEPRQVLQAAEPGVRPGAGKDYLHL